MNMFERFRSYHKFEQHMFERNLFWIIAAFPSIKFQMASPAVDQYGLPAMERNLEQIKQEMSVSCFRRWMIKAKAGKEIVCNARTKDLKEAFLLAFAFEANRQADKMEILEAIGGVRGVVDEVLVKVSSQSGVHSTSAAPAPPAMDQGTMAEDTGAGLQGFLSQEELGKAVPVVDEQKESEEEKKPEEEEETASEESVSEETTSEEEKPEGEEKPEEKTEEEEKPKEKTDEEYKAEEDEDFDVFIDTHLVMIGPIDQIREAASPTEEDLVDLPCLDGVEASRRKRSAEMVFVERVCVKRFKIDRGLQDINAWADRQSPLA